MSVCPLGTRWYNAVWRWHFYAGLLCIPFILWLATTGTIYLWRPQIEALLDRPYAHLATRGAVASPDEQVAAAIRAVPGSRLHRYILPDAPDAAASILVTRDGADQRVHVDTRSLAVLGVEREDGRPMPVVSRLHGQLLAGTTGSVIVEIAACWAIVMILTGLYLWWPRGRGLAGVVWPRLRGGQRLFWRDLHAVTGLWVSLLGLGLILTGLPWATAWGNYLREVRAITHAADGPVDWTIGGKSPASDHAGHHGMAMPAPPPPPGELARVIAAARPLAIAPPVMIAPPAMRGAPWSVTSDAADRPLRSEAKIDGATGRVVSTRGFGQRHWIDRIIGTGIAVHEGALFGLANQILGTLTALGLMLLAISGAVLWWRRRPVGLLGAPIPLSRPRFGWALGAAIVALALYLPLFGATLLLVLLVERGLLRRLAGPRRWLGLRAA
ncbi:PepSY-associated TM helix domain-containing protein [Sphingomonas oryzagri]|uniref:PepSY domain-containing protein n=1 Tax=Sphingomonas oryzagri TaxID=3042314 RepID=A0ABT6N4V0_9SPHN|nr:PepSY domain-containing protein [Sphingomonas oryzagri]MDH7639861.1 PepSY domain-containing protein [Sphingomonas oryzagri]